MRDMCVSGVGYLTNVHDEAQSGHPSVITEEMKTNDAHIRENRRFTTDELHEAFSDVSWSVIYDTFSTERFVQDGFQECLQRNTSRNAWLHLGCF